MGRRPDRPDEQAAKGFPGKRRSKTERAIAEAERLAGLLAAAPSTDAGALSPPAYLVDKRLAPALRAWEDHAPQLAKLNLLEQLDRHTFAIFCVYMGEFVAATDDVLANGYSVMVKTISGDKMPRDNPSVARRDQAVKVILDLSRRFGFTPLDRYGLFKDQAGSGLPLFGGGRNAGATDSAASAAGGGEAAPAAAPADEPAIGMLDRFDSAPPAGRPN